MYDFSHLIYDPQARLKVDFFSNGSQNGEWQTWKKPAGAKFIYFFAVGAGGSGGCSSNSVSNSRNGGGSGGGAGSTMAGMVPSIFVPNILYVQVGLGGIPVVVSNGVGTAGGNTYIGVDQQADPHGLFVFGPGGGGGNPGNTTAGGIASAGGIQAETAPPLCGLVSRGIYNADSSLHNSKGAAGGAGGFNGAGATLNGAASNLGPTNGGSGGGGSGNSTTATTSAGGLISFTMFANGGGSVFGGEFFSNNIGGLAGQNGNDGWIMSYPTQEYFYMGGSGGGGGNSSVTAGNGGNGSRGSGGGGAGGTWSTGALATPGKGGDGFAYIISYF